MLEIAFRPDAASPEPLYRQLAGYLRGLVAAGRLAPGERLPATRELAAGLGIGRNTVCRAYEILVDDGVLASHVGQGSFVTAQARPALRALRGGSEEAGQGASAPASFAWEGLIAARLSRIQLPRAGRGLSRELRAAGGSTRFDFVGGRVDADALPVGDLRRAWSRAFSDDPSLLSRPVDPRGLPVLRERIAQSLVARGIECDAEDVLVVDGIQQALDLVARSLVDPGDAVVVEEPGYFGATLAFRAAGARVVGIGVDAEGIRVDELARVLRARRAKLAYVTPSAQAPTGAVLSERRREALLELSDSHKLPIFEVDYDSELRFGSPPLPALKTRDPAGRVIYAGTFSKALFPGLRIGYVVAARPLLARLAMLRIVGDPGSDVVAQLALAELLSSGALERHVRRIRRLHAHRRDAMLSALERHMPEGTRFSPPRGGHQVWIELPAQVDPEALQRAAREEGISYVAGDFWGGDAGTADGPARFASFLSLAFVNQDEQRIEEGVALLGKLVAAQTSDRVRLAR